MPDSNASVSAADVERIAHYHAHVYYDPVTSRAQAERLRERIAKHFPQAKLGRWHDEHVGPHPGSTYQVAFPAAICAAASGDRR